MRFVTALALAGLLAAPLSAQQHGHQQREGTMPMHGQEHSSMPGMMGMMGMHAGPQMVLSLAEPLGLTDAQVERIQGIGDEAREAMRQHMQQAMQGMHDAAGLLKGDSPDLEAYEARLREAASHGVLAHTAMARAMVQVREVLSPEQREKLQTGLTMMSHMMRGQRGMMGEGMMRSMMMPGMMQGRMGAMQRDTTGMR